MFEAPAMCCLVHAHTQAHVRMYEKTGRKVPAVQTLPMLTVAPTSALQHQSSWADAGRNHGQDAHESEPHGVNHHPKLMAVAHEKHQYRHDQSCRNLV